VRLAYGATTNGTDIRFPLPCLLSCVGGLSDLALIASSRKLLLRIVYTEIVLRGIFGANKQIL